MPSFVIHLAIGKEYIKKNKIENEKEFLRGSIAPDFKNDWKSINKEKKESHFTSLINGKQVVEIDKFKNSQKVDIYNDFWKGYFLHILSDYFFYQKYFKKENERAIKENGSLYEDYNCINRYLIDFYNIELIEGTNKFTNFMNSEPKYLKLDKIKEFIDDMSNIKVDDILENKNIAKTGYFS